MESNHQNKKSVTYTFVDVVACNMCGTPAEESKTMGFRLNKSVGLKTKGKTGVSIAVRKCRRCGLIYNSPLPIPDSINQNYDLDVNEYWDHLDKLEDLDNQKEAIDQYGVLQNLTAPFQNKTALDIGSGIGQTMLALKKHGFDVYGLEPSPSFYHKAIEWTGFDSDKFQLSSLEDASYPENTFDYISFLNVLEHLYDPDKAIQQTLNWLKPGGLMFICIPNANWLSAKAINLFYKCMFSDFVTNTSPMHVPFHLYEFSEKSFLKNAAKNGYEIAKIEVKTSMPINKIDKLLTPIQRITGTGLRLDVWIRKTEN